MNLMTNSNKEIDIKKSKDTWYDDYAVENTAFLKTDAKIELPTVNSENDPAQYYIVLAHELAHTWDFVLNGNLNDGVWYYTDKIMGNRPVYISEWYACIVENYVRIDHDLPLRTHYGYTYENEEGWLVDPPVPDSRSYLFESVKYDPVGRIMNYQYIQKPKPIDK